MARIFKGTEGTILLHFKHFLDYTPDINTVVLFTTDVENVVRIHTDIRCDDSFVEVVVKPTDFDNMEDGVINYILEGSDVRIERQSNNYLKTPISNPTTGIQLIREETLYENGEYTINPDHGYKGMAEVKVNVAVDTDTPYWNGIEDQKSKLEDITITDNGTYEREDGYNEIIVEVPHYDDGYAVGREEGYNQGDFDGYKRGYETGELAQKLKLENIVITENGTYEKEDGYNLIHVDVPDLNGDYNEGVADQKAKLSSIEISRNGSYSNEDGYNNIYVNVGETKLVPNGVTFEGNTTFSGAIPAEVWIKNDWSKVYDCERMFYECLNLTDIGTDSFIEAGIKPFYSTREMFSGCYKLEKVPEIDTSDVEDMYHMFNNCNSLKSISVLNTSKVTNMDGIFYQCYDLETIPELDTSNVTTMTNLFYNCNSLKSVSFTDTSNVTTMTSLFYNCNSLETVSGLDTSKITTLSNFFGGCNSLKSFPQLDTSNVTNMSYMFRYCRALETIPTMDTSNVTTMEEMFNDCKSLKSIPQLDTSNVTNMKNMFKNCSSLETIPLLDTSNITNMEYFFNGCSSLKTIPLINTSNVTYMLGMFNECSSLTELIVPFPYI